MKAFSERTAIITGSASGIGLLTAWELARQGANVVLADCNEEQLEQEAQKLIDAGYHALPVVTDVTDYAQVQACTDRAMEVYHSIDIMVNCAGGNPARLKKRSEPWHEMPYDVISWGIDLNLKGAVFFSRAVLGVMMRQKQGVIVNVSSIDALTGSCFGLEYSACKSGLIGFTKSLALYGAPNQVRSVCVIPGPVMTRPAMANMKTPLGRAAEPIEVVDFICYLCSDKAKFITGSAHLIDGARACGGL